MEEDIDLLEDEFEEEFEEETNRSYAMELTIVAMLVATVFLSFFDRFYVVVPAGHKGALYSYFRGGTQLNGVYYDEGLGFKFPWDKVILYNTRILEHQDTITALTTDGLEVTAEISYRYFPDYYRIGLLHRELGPDYLQSILVPHITSITRNVISHYRVDKLYSTGRDSIQIDMTQRSQKQITDNYPITIIDIVVRNIVLPKQVENAIAKKLVQEQLMLEYDFKLKLEEKEAMRKVIEASGDKDALLIEAEGKKAARLVEARGIKDFRDTSELNILQWEGINATKELAKSPNAKVVVIGTNSGDLPIILGGNN
ncbi:MAG: prohibitin family protein [Saprospiraceae bacterium]